jgi:protein-disulfide isomerase
VKEGAKLMAVGGLAALLGAGAVALATTGDAPVNTTDKAAIEKIVREYILNNPEILPEAMANLQARELAKVVKERRKEIETPFAGAWEGNPNGDVVLVEFFDYACGYCRAALPEIAQLLKDDPKLKIVYREMPVLGQGSYDAALASLAAAKQGKYMDFHKAMFGAGRPDAGTIAAAQRVAKMDGAATRAFSSSKEAEAELSLSNDLQRALQLSGTPSWVVGDKVMVGAVGMDALKVAITEARKAKN